MRKALFIAAVGVGAMIVGGVAAYVLEELGKETGEGHEPEYPLAR